MGGGGVGMGIKTVGWELTSPSSSTTTTTKTTTTTSLIRFRRVGRGNQVGGGGGGNSLANVRRGKSDSKGSKSREK